MLFSPNLKVDILSKDEEVPGRLLDVRANIRIFLFLFVNIYASNNGADRVQFFSKLGHILKQQQDGDVIVFGGALDTRPEEKSLIHSQQWV